MVAHQRFVRQEMVDILPEHPSFLFFFFLEFFLLPFSFLFSIVVLRQRFGPMPGWEGILKQCPCCWRGVAVNRAVREPTLYGRVTAPLMAKPKKERFLVFFFFFLKCALQEEMGLGPLALGPGRGHVEARLQPRRCWSLASPFIVGGMAEAFNSNCGNILHAKRVGGMA